MKTMVKKFRMESIVILVLTFCIQGITIARPGLSGRNTGIQDSAMYNAYTGKIVDSESKEPIVFASIYLEGSSIGTVTNIDGEFILKVPSDKSDEKLSISFIGYKTQELALNSLAKNKNIIKLVPDPIPIQEVIIRTGDPIELLRKAIGRIDENYGNTPAMLTGFYRETIKQNRHYIAVSEAVLDVYKAGYTNEFEFDRVKIYKGRKSQDVKKMDTVIFKLQGGPKTSLLLDVIKNPSALLTEDYFRYYNYKLAGIVNIDDRETYVIEFNQKENVDLSLYQGRIYLDVQNLAVVRLDFSISEQAISKAGNELVRKKPVSMKVDVEDAKYLANYRESNGKWQLNHVRAEAKFRCKWNKKLFRSTYITMIEMAVTDRDTVNINKFKYRESAKISDVFIDQVNYFMDDDFWGAYNVIKPDETIESAISRLNKKLERNNK